MYVHAQVYALMLTVFAPLPFCTDLKVDVSEQLRKECAQHKHAHGKVQNKMSKFIQRSEIFVGGLTDLLRCMRISVQCVCVRIVETQLAIQIIKSK